MALLDFLILHWPFIAFGLIAGLLTKLGKATVFSAERARAHRGWWWGRKWLPAIPVGLGALVGLIPGMPASAGVETVAAKCLYFACSGVLCVYLYTLIQRRMKERTELGER